MVISQASDHQKSLHADRQTEYHACCYVMRILGRPDEMLSPRLKRNTETHVNNYATPYTKSNPSPCIVSTRIHAHGALPRLPPTQVSTVPRIPKELGRSSYKPLTRLRLFASLSRTEQCPHHPPTKSSSKPRPPHLKQSPASPPLLPSQGSTHANLSRVRKRHMVTSQPCKQSPL